MTNDGSTTPSVASTAPSIPPVFIPTKVAIFTASGPGVLSLSATKSTSSDYESQPCCSASYCIMAIIEYPPPKVNAPIFRKIRNSSSSTISLLLSHKKRPQQAEQTAAYDDIHRICFHKSRKHKDSCHNEI